MRLGLSLYSKPNELSQFTSRNPFVLTFDGRIGGAQDKLVYVRNNASDRWYDSIQLVAVDTDGIDIVDGTTAGWSWKLKEKDTAPTSEEWAIVSAGNTLSLGSSLGNTSMADIVTYLPVWVRVEIPRGQRIQTIIDVVLQISAQEHLIDG
jgi:hypothetical protein